MKPIYFLLITVLFFNIFSAKSQIIERNLLHQAIQHQKKLTLVALKDFKPFPQTPDGWKQALPPEVIAKLIQKGEASLKQKFNDIPATVMLEYTRTGNRKNYEKLSFEKRSWLQDLVMAEAVEGKGRFVDQIVNGIWSICEESFWGISAHVGLQKAGSGLPDVNDPVVDLFAAETGALLSWTDYLVGPQLDKASKLVRPRIKTEISRRILTPMLTANYGWMGGGNPKAKLNNWAPWVASNYITAALLIEPDETKRTQAFNLSVKIVDQYINGLGFDGACDEGPGYWEAAGGCVFDALNLFYDATGGKINIYKDPIIKKMGSYIHNVHISGQYFINVADAHSIILPDGLMIYRFGKAMGDLTMQNFGSWSYQNLPRASEGIQRSFRSRYLYNLLAIKNCSSAKVAESLVDDFWYSDVQLMASRSTNGLYVASHGGHNAESHNHNDVGDFIVYADGFPMIIDVGSGIYTYRTFSKDRYQIWFNTSPFHNLPTINGQEQKSGIKFAANDVSYLLSDKSAELKMNIASAYPKEAGVKTWVREVSMNKGKDIIIADHFEMNTSLNTLTQSFMSVCETDLSKPGQIAFILPNKSKVYLDYDAKLWTASKENIELKIPEDQDLKKSWEGKDIWRILLKNKFHDEIKVTNYRIHK